MKALTKSLFVFILCISGAGFIFAADVIDESLRLRFNFDSAPVGNVIVDSSPSATHPGTNSGAIWAESTSGRSGVMNFKAPIPHRITIPAIPALNSSSGTISFWIKTPGNLVRGNEFAMLMDRRTSSDGDVITLGDNGTIFVQAKAGGQTANSFSANTIINDNNWHHVAYVYDQSAFGSISIYIDGVLDIFQANSIPWSWPASQPLALGSSPDPWWRVFVGLMDDVQIHNRALSAAEIAATFAGNPVLDSSLVERLNFTAAPENDVVVDSSASNNPATNTGATWVTSDTGRNGLMRFDLAFTQITVAPHADFDSTTGTIAFWVKTTGNTGPGDFASIIFDRRTSDGDVITMKDDGTIFVQAQGSWARVNTLNTQASVKDGDWHHVAYVYDQAASGSIRIYIDGASSAFQNNSGAWAWPVDQQLEFGLSYDSYWFGFDGALDDIRIYNRPLSAEEVGRIGVAPTLRFDVPPVGQTVFAGDDVLFTATANMPATYQWQLSGADLAGATATALRLLNVQATNAGPYTVTASNATFGTITSTPAMLIVNPRPSVPSSLVARYNFDAAPVGEVIMDSAPGSRHPGTNLLATWVASVDGRSGVMQFSEADPGSQIVVPPHTDFDTSKGTIAFWMKTSGNGTYGNFGSILFERRTGRGDVIVLQDEGTLFVQAYSSYFPVNAFSTTTMVNHDIWHHIAYVYDQGALGGIRFYVDGQSAGENPNSGPWSWEPSEPLELGKSSDSWWRRYQGYLDDVQFYNRMLSAAEITQSMTLGPFLTFSRSGNQLTISWTQNGFVLQQNSNLGDPLGWADVSGGGSSPVNVTIPSTGNRYYRLRN